MPAPEPGLPKLSPTQVATLEGLLRAGFTFVSIEHFERYLAVEKAGFVALLEISGEMVRKFGGVGYRLGNGIGVLVDRPGGRAFIWKSESVAASPQLLADYERVKNELDELLGDSLKQ